jgi:hypothetical protein
MLDAATLVGTTLSGAALDAFPSAAPFGTVIIDEAAQAVEPAALVPLARAPSCVLVRLLSLLRRSRRGAHTPKRRQEVLDSQRRVLSKSWEKVTSRKKL